MNLCDGTLIHSYTKACMYVSLKMPGLGHTNWLSIQQFGQWMHSVWAPPLPFFLVCGNPAVAAVAIEVLAFSTIAVQITSFMTTNCSSIV